MPEDAWAPHEEQPSDAWTATGAPGHEWADPRGIGPIRQAVDALLADGAAVAAMTPLQHLGWARSLPVRDDDGAVPPDVIPSVRAVERESVEQLADNRLRALRYWQQRKRMTDAKWAERYRQLPDHVRSVLGAGKNLLLFQAGYGQWPPPVARDHAARIRQEMCEAAEVDDRGLIRDLQVGFPLLGDIPGLPGGGNSATPGELDMEGLVRRIPEFNKRTLNRIARDSFPDAEVEVALQGSRDPGGGGHSARARLPSWPRSTRKSTPAERVGSDCRRTSSLPRVSWWMRGGNAHRQVYGGARYQRARAMRVVLPLARRRRYDVSMT